MAETPNVKRCANPHCRAEFKRFGEGRLSVFRVSNPAEWGLPDDTRLKAVWLCRVCAANLYIQVDFSRHVIQAVRRPA